MNESTPQNDSGEESKPNPPKLGSAPAPAPSPHAVKKRASYDAASRPRKLSQQRKTHPLLVASRRFIVSVGLLFGAIFRALMRFLRSWRTRKFRHLVQGLPALLMLIGVISVSAALSLNRDELIPTYQEIAEQASLDGKLDESLLYHKKLIKLDGGSPETVFEYAQDLLKTGVRSIEQGEELVKKDQKEEGERRIGEGQNTLNHARSLILEIAPAESAGYPKAHLYRAQIMFSDPKRYLLADDGTTLKPAGVRELHHHLLTADAGMPDNLEVQMGLYYYFLGLNQFKEATRHLERVARKRPHLRYELADRYFRMGDRENALRNLKLASDYYEDLVRKKPDHHEARARCATIRLNMGDLEGCINMLEFGLARIDADQKNPYPALLAQTHVSVYDVLSQQKDIPLEVRLKHLRAALQYVTDYQPALVRMIAFVSVPGEEGDKIATHLQQMIAEGRMPAIAHFALGMKAWRADELDKAIFHLERAYELDPNQGFVGNNLAYFLSKKNPPDLDRSLQIIDGVVQAWPSVATYRDTKGQILVKRGEWAAALVELEAALPAMNQSRELHELLAKVYEELGKPELAREHLRLANDIVSQQKPAASETPTFQFGSDFPAAEEQEEK